MQSSTVLENGRHLRVLALAALQIICNYFVAVDLVSFTQRIAIGINT